MDREEPETRDSSEEEREDDRRLRASLGEILLLLLLEASLEPLVWAIAVNSAEAEVGMPLDVSLPLDRPIVYQNAAKQNACFFRFYCFVARREGAFRFS